MMFDDPHGLFDGALLVGADREAEVAGVDVLAVGGDHDAGADHRDALHANEHVHGLASDPFVLGVEQRG
jgi:hypothetical protein